MLWLQTILLATAAWTAAAPATPAVAPTLQRIVALGDPVAGVTIGEDSSFGVGALNNRGQICFTTEDEDAGRLLVQRSEDGFKLLAAPGAHGPAGRWPDNLWIDQPVSMNQAGSVVFSGLLVPAGGGGGGTFVWSYPDRKVTPVAVPGMASVGDQSFDWAAGPSPTISNQGEIALVAQVRNSAGRSYYGVFVRQSDKRLTPIAVPDQVMPDRKVIISAYQPTIRDDGVVGLLLKRQGDALEYPFVWEKGALAALPTAGIRPRGKLLIGFSGIWVNNANRAVLLDAQLHSLAGHFHGLYRVVDGKLSPVAEPGQPMPGGGTLSTVHEHGVSAPNDRGQHAFLATLDGGATALYRLDADGTVSLLLKSGMSTNLGKVTNVGQGHGDSWGVGINGEGKVALVVSVADGPDTLVVSAPGGV
jgi:hypothetical protein